MSHFVYSRNYRLCCSGRFWGHRPYFIIKFLLSMCILFIHFSFVYQVSIDLIYFSPTKFFLGPCIQPGRCSEIVLNYWVIWASVFLWSSKKSVVNYKIVYFTLVELLKIFPRLWHRFIFPRRESKILLFLFCCQLATQEF